MKAAGNINPEKSSCEYDSDIVRKVEMQRKVSAILFNAVSLVLIVIGCGCKTTSMLYGVNINGMVYDFDNRPVAGYHLKLNSALEVVTDITGRFTFEKVKLGEYVLKGQSNAFEPYEGQVTIYDQNQVLYLRVPSFSQLINRTDKALEEDNLQEAEAFLTRAVAMNSEHIDSLLYGAILAYRKNNIGQALELLGKVQQKGYTAEWVMAFYDELQRIDRTSKAKGSL